MESEGHEEEYRAVIDGETQDDRVGQRWGRSSLHYGDEGALIQPTYTKVFAVARYGRTARDLRRTGRVPGVPTAINTNPYTIGQSCSLFFANALQYASRLTANLPVRYTFHGSPGL